MDRNFFIATLLTVAVSLVVRIYNGKSESGELQRTTVINGHECIDLGLPSGLKWATMNLGAYNQYESGFYFAWGEIAPRQYYNPFLDEQEYATLKFIELVDDNDNLTPAHDAATAYWGDGWRMPTHDDFNELEINCSWQWYTMENVNGYKVTGPNGNWIFLPAAGYRGYSLKKDGECGHYWSSTVYKSDCSYAYLLDFDKDSDDTSARGQRSLGRTIRPVSK